MAQKSANPDVHVSYKDKKINKQVETQFYSLTSGD